MGTDRDHEELTLYRPQRQFSSLFLKGGQTDSLRDYFVDRKSYKLFAVKLLNRFTGTLTR